MIDAVSEAQTLPREGLWGWSRGGNQEPLWVETHHQQRGAKCWLWKTGDGYKKHRDDQILNAQAADRKVIPQLATTTPKNTDLCFLQECLTAHIQSTVASGLQVRISKEDQLCNITIGF